MKRHSRSFDRTVSPFLVAAIGMVPMLASADAPPAPPRLPAPNVTLPMRLVAPRAPVVPQAVQPASDVDGVAGGSVGALTNPFFGNAVAPHAVGQTLTAPVTINANTSADALIATQTGSGRALNGVINNPGNSLTALKGTTNGSGAALGGLNSGTTGAAGQFQITNAASNQPGIVSTTAGGGSAVKAVISSTATVDTPAILGQHNGVKNYGIGVQGDGAFIGVKGTATGTGSYGVYGTNTNGPGVYGESSSGLGASGVSTNGVGVFGQSTGDNGVYGISDASNGVYGYSSSGAGVYGESSNNYGVYAHSSNAYGLVAASDSTFAGVFYGPMYVSGKVVAASYDYTSDRAQKQGFAPVDAADLLDRIAAMPITSWDYIARPSEHHIGPMAQDFRAAFGLGTDDRHIDVVDGIGVSLAAIQALQRQVKDKDTRIAALESQASAMAVAVDARFAALEQSAGMAAMARAASGDR